MGPRGNPVQGAGCACEDRHDLRTVERFLGRWGLALLRSRDVAGMARMAATTTITIVATLAMAIALVMWPARAWAKEAVGKVGALIGEAHIIRGGQKLPAKKGLEVFSTDSLQTAPRAVVKIQFTDGGSVMAFENSTMTIEQYDVKRQGDKISLKSAIDIAKGKVRFFVKPGPNRSNDASFKSKNAVMGIRGTSGFIQTSGEKTQLVVMTGKVELKNPANPSAAVFVQANQVSEVMGSASPTKPAAASPQLIRSLSANGDSAAESAGEDERGDEDARDDNQDKQDKKQKSDEQMKQEEKGEQEDKTKQEEPTKSQGSGKEGGSSQEGGRQQGGVDPNKGTSPDEKGQGAAVAQPSSEKKESRPVPVKRVVVFGQDGNAAVSVGDASTSSFVAPIGQGVVSGGATQEGSQTGTSNPTSLATVSAVQATGADGAMQQVQLATSESQKIQEQIQQTVVESLQEATSAIEAAKEVASPVPTPPPTSKTVRVRVVLPNP